jgi:hypothetical protein
MILLKNQNNPLRQIEKQKDQELRCLGGNPFVRHEQKIGDGQRTKAQQWFSAHSPKWIFESMFS